MGSDKPRGAGRDGATRAQCRSLVTSTQWLVWVAQACVGLRNSLTKDGTDLLAMDWCIPSCLTGRKMGRSCDDRAILQSASCCNAGLRAFDFFKIVPFSMVASSRGHDQISRTKCLGPPTTI